MSSDSSESSPFAGALKLSLSEMAFPDADELFERRIRVLEKFSRPNLPDSLVSKSTDAIRLTRDAQKACDSFASFARDIADIPRDGARLLLIASHVLEKYETTAAVEPETQEVNRLARSYFISAVVRELEAGTTDKTFKEILDDCVVGADDLMRFALMTQANLLMVEQKSLAISADTLPSLATLGLIWRGLFYAAVIGSVGGSLEKDLARQKFMEIVADASSKVLGVVPMAGDMFDIAKTLVNMWSAMRHKEEHIDELVQQIQSAQEYIDTYHSALSLWIRSAVEVKNAAIAFAQSFETSAPS